jgi:hypothetical protein
MRWFQGADPYTLDSRPWDDDPVGWYRFDAPVGTAALRFDVDGDPRVWVDGDERPVNGGRVALDRVPTDPVPVAVRVAQSRGAYGGAAFAGPVAVETDRVPVPLRRWEDLGLADYSGRGRYRATVDLPATDPGDRVRLDLGDLHATAAVRVNGVAVGAVCSRPFRIDVSEAVTSGTNEIEVEVANTLANHFDGETPGGWSADVSSGVPNLTRDEPASGLLGPVTLRIEPSVTVSARRSTADD